MAPTFQPIDGRTEEIVTKVIDAAFKVHRNLGPGLLESVYEICLSHELSQLGLSFQRQLSLPVKYDNFLLEAGLRIDLLVEDAIIIELKSVEQLNPLYDAQLLTYLKLTGKRIGLLMNFNVRLLKDGIKRLVL